MNAEFWVPLVLLIIIGLFTTGAAWMMGWSFRSGQFENQERNAACIFDDDEPVGEKTDRILR